MDDLEAGKALLRGGSAEYPLHYMPKASKIPELAHAKRHRNTKIIQAICMILLAAGAITCTIIWCEHSGFYEFQTYTSSADHRYHKCREKLDARGISYEKVTCPSYASADPYNPLSTMAIAFWITLFFYALVSIDMFWAYVPLVQIQANALPLYEGGRLRGNTRFWLWYRTTIGLSSVTNSITDGVPNGVDHLINLPLFVGLAMFFISFTSNHDVTAKSFAGIIGGWFVLLQYFSCDLRKTVLGSIPTFVAWAGMIVGVAMFFLIEGIYSYKHYLEFTDVHEGAVKAAYWCSFIIFVIPILQIFFARCYYWIMRGKNPDTGEPRGNNQPIVVVSEDGQGNKVYYTVPNDAFFGQYVIHNFGKVFILVAAFCMAVGVGHSYSDSISI